LSRIAFERIQILMKWPTSGRRRFFARGHHFHASSGSFLVPFVVDYEGQRFGKYPLGWPAMLALGIALGARSLVNPLLAGLGVWLTYRLGKRTLGETVGLLAAGLTLTSPFFLLNSGSLLSPFGLVTAAFALAGWMPGTPDCGTN
jgi:4-amino-4-deoxy-L-arabinose transferase-like glycosyltransferase